MTPKELHLKIWEQAKKFKFPKDLYKLVNTSDEYYQEVNHLGVHKNNYSYNYLACMAKYLKPKYIVELGGAKGVGSLALSLGGPVYSCDTRDGWEYANRKNITKLVGSSLEIEWPINLDKVGLWYIDSNHEADHVQKEIDRYSSYWKNTVVMFDDVFYYKPVFDKLTFPKYYEGKDGLRGNGWGLVCV